MLAAFCQRLINPILMAKKRISLGERYQRAFGYVASSAGGRLQQVGFADKEGATSDTSTMEVFISSDGSFEEMTLSGGDLNLYFASMIGNRTSAGLIFAPPPMVTFDRQKTITTTPIDDSDGDSTDDAVVVERYNSGQWDIKIQGLLIDMVNHRFPKQHLVTLRSLFDVNDTLEVSGEFWDALNIKNIYLQSINITGVQGYEDTLQFSLQAFSIKPVEYFLKNK